ncbi:posphoenolpyruvate synthetase regulatory kinase/phosphorylase PpsR [Nitrincola tapanii]|uniref:Putative phosphoenolpyruvate synthase regulatory protein n=1 Tax=Nitrincola tapanii TaxID=1708751 RepID=A0A5A9W4D3_9GAMM|nr:pyruvate, water dikinase regulatory protein [Nitrincola tapanii]KAA0875482.1 kinase/pyrophosphorylase [Nitrincola tapanii]
MKKRTAFFISDGTGITAETLGNSLLTQFEGIHFEMITLPYIDTLDKAQNVVEKINSATAQDGELAIVFDTIVNPAIREKVASSQAFKIDVFESFLKPLEHELQLHSSYSVGKSHAINESSRYKERIASVNFALDNDDGGRIQQYGKADLILVGVSRCGKTPTCLYMALQFGIRAANYPITIDDLERSGLPDVLMQHRNKLFGLTIDPFHLAAIRHERRPNSRYASLEQCEFEVREVERRFAQLGIGTINTTHFSVEEIATRIMADAGLTRRIV